MEAANGTHFCRTTSLAILIRLAAVMMSIGLWGFAMRRERGSVGVRRLVSEDLHG
jgi:hypothetical protein